MAMMASGAKRKIDEFQSSPDDSRCIDSNTLLAPCGATGLRGLYNMGQTCFMSVVIQSLIHNPIVRNFFLGDGHDSTKCDREICLSCAMDEVFTEFFASDKTDGFGAVDILAKSWLTQQGLFRDQVGNEMQDAHEYLHFVLGQLHASNGGGSDLSDEEVCECIIHKSFYGKLQSDVTCEKCHNVTTAVDPVMELNLELQGRSNAMEAEVHGTIQDLHSCFDRFTSPEKLNNYNCERCSATDQGATKQLSLSRLPSVLCLQLKRFANVSSTSSKLDYKVQFPLQLDAFTYTARSKRSKAVGSEMYDLLGVIVHLGTIDTGHYVSYAREGRQDRIRELSQSTLEALSQFYSERDDRQKKFEDLKVQDAEDANPPISMEMFAEDWNASQFWYDDETASTLAKQLLEGVKDDLRVGFISAPSVFVQFKRLMVSGISVCRLTSAGR
ncbi:hypothetical protein FGG08_001777 [Glutinoglossum americanum]|uniref:Ubiquitin carboxyl-terminal hydrolase n=1 Tax=Glutinoglossum americanum TaxID=1670608 RepID=A0A9P8KZX9_9PEZI|nr:hypothetical protein FGG08_001777 [Glutinoglossum americanum]